MTTVAEACIIYRDNLKLEPAITERTVLLMPGHLLRDRAWFLLSYQPVQEVFEVISVDMVRDASINISWPLSGFPPPQYKQSNAP